MPLKNISFQRSYETLDDREALINNFYIPALKETYVYNRVAGFFSSSAFSVAAEGIAPFIENGGKMRLLISPELSDKDAKVLNGESNIPFENMELFDDVGSPEWIANDNVRALAWLLKENRLEIKIVIDQENQNTLFHQKVGIMVDHAGDAISFSGSINESAKAWLSNIEEFKVFKSWEEGQSEYFKDDYNKFKRYWNMPLNNHIKVYSVPDAIKNKIIKVSPVDVYDLELMSRYKKKCSGKTNKLSLFDHQKNAITSWVNNEFRLLDVMATGTGKTRTALGCICEVMGNDKLMVVISTPENSLTNQWLRDIEGLNLDFDKVVRIRSGNKWKSSLENSFLELQLEKKKNAVYVLLTTHSLSSSKEFVNIVKNNKGKLKLFYICDECHAIGSAVQQNALIEEYEMRLGLSATPERMFDEFGTDIIYKYFGNKTFEFGIYEALNTINPITKKPYLNRYKYLPVFVELTDDEWSSYKKLSRQITMIRQKIEDGDENYSQEQLEKKLNARAKVVKNAHNKMECYSSLLSDLQSRGEINNIISFVSDVRIGEAMDIAKEHGLFVAKVTEEESTLISKNRKISDRDKVLLDFRTNKLNMLFGMACLDQGIDIPNARIAILLSNSTNPREYVQRIGRVIRYSPNKDVSLIYDFIAIQPDFYETEDTSLILKESKRVAEIACNAENYEEVKDIFEEKGVSLDEHK